MVERRIVAPEVAGSSPVPPTIVPFRGVRLSQDMTPVRVETWTSPDEQTTDLVLLPRPLHDALVAFVDRGAIPNEPEYFTLVCDGRSPLATREERSAIAARIANERGIPAPVTTWTTVAY